MKNCLLAGCVLGVSMGLPAMAATSLVNSLTGLGAAENDGGANDSTEQASTVANLAAVGLEPTHIWGGGDGTPDDPDGHPSWERVEMSTTGAQFGLGTGSDGGRNYLRTIETDYHTMSTTVSVLFTTDGNVGSQNMFLGLGTGDRGTYNIADFATGNAAAVMELGNGGFGHTYLFSNPGEGLADNRVSFPSISWGAGTHLAQMMFDAAVQEVTFSVDLGNNGSEDGSITRDVSGVMVDWSVGENAAVFIGGDDGLRMSNLDITVVPEPSIFVLIGLGSFGLARRRR